MLARPDPVLRARDPAPRAFFVERMVRSFPIRWRILSIAVLNSAVALILLALIWNGARVLGDAWADLRQVRASERFLTELDGDAERLQGLIHRFFAGSDPVVLSRIVLLRDALESRLRVQARLDPLIAAPSHELLALTEDLVAGFDRLREVREGLSRTNETKILTPARDMAALYAILTSSANDVTSLILPTLAKSREAFNQMILAANAFFLSGSAGSARDARDNAAAIRRTAPVMLDLAVGEVQRRALEGLNQRAELVERGIDDLGQAFGRQATILRESIDRNAEAMSAAIDLMKAGIGQLERSAQSRFDRTLSDVALKLAVLATAFVTLVALMGIAIARSIREPLSELRAAMVAITAGDYERRVGGLTARDEMAEMARAVEVFRENAIAKRRAEEELRAAKEGAETALADLRAMQGSLIEAEKLAALGGLVAGVAHEVNNPVGISLTVASSLASRADDFSAEVASGQLRRSRLDDFTASVRDAAAQLVANLKRAGELVQSFKQVAVDRSETERRSFDLREATEQILASLRPTLRKSGLKLQVDMPDGLVLDGFPGPLGQIITNLVLNSVLHAFEGREEGTITISAVEDPSGEIRILFRDDGSGMSETVQRRAFDPFFTTRRGTGGTGLGLHIVYNLATQRLGGRIALSSKPGEGTTFLIVLPRTAPPEPARAPDSAARGALHA